MNELAQSTFDEICEALAMMGLSRVIAAPVVTHACRVAGILPEQLGPANVAALGPILERSLRMYLGHEQVAESLKRVYALGLGQDVRPTTRSTLVAVASNKGPAT